MNTIEDLVNRWIWQEDFWLPPGVTWKDIAEGTEGGSRHPAPRDLIICLPLALSFIALRIGFERAVAQPLSRLLGVRDRVRVGVAPIPTLEAFYHRKKSQPCQSEIAVLEKRCGLTQRQIQTWLHHRRKQDKPSNTRKFCEASWRFVFYLVVFSGSLVSLVNTPWFWDQKECWRGYPKQAVAEAQYWYYVTELSFYLSLLLCVSVDTKRKDFKEQIVHHVATIFLIAFSYCGNFVRVGTLVMLVHDSSDFLLESAKMFNYAGWRKTCDALFVIFAAVFLITRLVVFPCRVVYTTAVDCLDVFPPFPGYYFFNCLLLVLQALHVFWAWLILRMVYKFVFLGKVERDERSDEESEVEEVDGREEEHSWEKNHGALNSKLASLANNCVLNNLTNQRGRMKTRKTKAR
ncbi:ceramide synthase 4a isoform X1 [Triplophysa dalaica]|uniref:ceramide synthase 4a isoform X1 n=1 Tax=Triplophysa dalaica TaxID=1582913 RepID=UPI0024E038D2|nr:ceramide synthase 4a isoform X1 [Triplophysa dalaica]XP_056613944.1 ceramide synthase 4a isoform X1 [Triplophysa dalaica]XP_056613945.1 ceramide synthase 4a isoform X1 [Triplophysa dalaica]XP_056613946.1 ceramide synthase 4a isoform X1 [Triplophysa dalaica]XP_056613947.1 ceramide synthase 4a isoform X1 [Triplophysa dalaica]XP_056613949.1 ceramide synthase 4a isoform X1 [Triplophysa dalaica]XP_056613950.1 ceramide synthase 4a isoform X1 [Triplophysa dalaica]XP_056613951.1 ceramide synthase